MSAARTWIRTVVIALIAIAVVVVATRVSRRLFEAPETASLGTPQTAVAAPGAPPAGGDDGHVFEVMSATGRVEVQRGDGWAPISQGDRLTRADVVRTSAASGAVLRLAAGTEIELRAGVEIRLDAWSAGGPAPAGGQATGAAAPSSPSGASVDLRRGKVLARVGAAGGLSINARDTRTTSEGPARFVVLADEHGRVAVATISGTTRFAAGGKSVVVPAGTASASQAGAPPDDPEHISEEVFLNVVWPTVDRRGEHAEIKGRATPSSVVTVRAPTGLETAAVGADGQFSVTVPVGVGKTPIEVEAEDLVGHTKQTTTTLTRRPPPPPALTPETTDLWKKQADKMNDDPKPADPAETVARLRELLAAAGRLAEFGRFAAQQIHELRQPLFAIKGLAQLLLEKDRVELDEVLDFARHIVEQSERLTSLVSSLRQLSLPATHDAARRSELGAVLLRVTSLLDFRLRKAGATLRTQIAPDLPLLVISPHALEQILINLLANALDAIAGVTHPVVQVRARVLAENPRFAIVDVADNGSGIAKTLRHRLFESFFTTKGEEQGTGLGLAVSREIARTSGGDLELLEDPGTWGDPANTVFRLTLPVSQEL